MKTFTVIITGSLDAAEPAQLEKLTGQVVNGLAGAVRGLAELGTVSRASVDFLKGNPAHHVGGAQASVNLLEAAEAPAVVSPAPTPTDPEEG